MYKTKTFLKKLLLTAILFLITLSFYAQNSSKEVICYISLIDLKTIYNKPGKDKTGADLITVYFEELKKNKGRVVDFYYLKINEDKKYIDMIAVYKGDKIDKNFRNILFYADPMYPNDFTQIKKKDHMGMEYAPVYSD